MEIKDYNNFKLMDMYSDYGDTTGIQTIRRFIEHCNKYFVDMNETMKEFIKTYTDLNEIMTEFEAFQKAWDKMQSEYADFIENVQKQLDEWIDNPEVQEWLILKLEELLAISLDGKLDKSTFNTFKTEDGKFKTKVDGKIVEYDKFILDFGVFKIDYNEFVTKTNEDIQKRVTIVDFNKYKTDTEKVMLTKTNILDLFFPIGDLKITTDDKNPGLTIGGVWERFAPGRALVGYDVSQPEFDTIEKTGGEKEHTLTIAEMPAHRHTITAFEGTNDVYKIMYSSGANGSVSSGPDTLATGGSKAHNNLQPYIVVYVWKRIG